MNTWVKAGGLAMLVAAAGMLGWMTMVPRKPTVSAPEAGPAAAETRDAEGTGGAGSAAEFATLLADLASKDVARREAGQKALEDVPAERYEEVISLGAKQTDPEVRARLHARAAQMVEELVSPVSHATPASTRVLIGLLSQQKDGNERNRTIGALTNRMANSEWDGGDGVVPALAGVLPDVTNESSRIAVCTMADYDLTPGTLDAGRTKQMTEMMRERLKNDPSAEVRFWAACALAECGDNSGMPELKKDALAMQAAGDGMFSLGNNSATNMLPWVDALMPALEKATGRNFEAKPIDTTTRPFLIMHGEMIVVAERRERLAMAVAWFKTNPGTEPAMK